MKVGIYIRVSTEEQAKEGYSISGQLKKLKAFCISQNWTVVGVYADEGISAKDMNRNDLQRMLEDVEKGIIDCVLVYRLDRLTRSVFDLYKLLETFDKHNCKFKSATEVYDTTTAMGRMFITIVAALAQWERENMGERISFGFQEKARQGKCPFNFSPIGYTLNREESKLYIEPTEAKTIKIIFEKYIGGFGSNRLCRYLNENNLLTKRGNKWSSDTLFKVLKSPVPAGGIRWNEETNWGTHEPIISREMWDEAQNLMKRRKSLPAKTISSPHIFSRMIKCGGCGQMLTGTQSSYKKSNGERNVYYYYRCANYKVGRCSNSKTFSENPIEKAFLKTLNTWDFSKFTKNVANKGIVEEPKIKIDKEKLKKKLTKIEKLKKKWQYAWAEDLIDHVDFKKRMDEANEDEKQINDQLKNAIEEDKNEETYSTKEIEIALKEIKVNWNELSSLEKKNLLSEIISYIQINRVGETTYIENIEFF